jgi:asparagine synthase (glutamine-hydrolysing)
MPSASNMSHVHPDGKPHLGIRLLTGAPPQVSGSASHLCGARFPGARAGRDDGIFVQWRWDGDTLRVENDRYGIYPLFYCAKADSIWISPSLELVVRGNSERALDHAALAVFHRLGHFIGEDTPFKDIRFLPPDSVLTWRRGELSIQSRPFELLDSGKGLGFDDAVEAYRERFARAMARRLPREARFTVPISGGRDSRHILLELAQQGAVPSHCPTLHYRPPATNQDVAVARELTRRLGIQHDEIARPSSYFEASLKDVGLTNHCGGGHGWVMPLASHVAGRYDELYDGLAGSVLSGGFMLAEDKLALFRSQRFEPLARLILGASANEGALKNVLAPPAYAQWSLDAAIERLLPELQRHADRPNPVLSFVFWNRTRRCVGSIPYAILHQVRVVHTPYLDHELFDLLFELDPAHVEDNRLHDEVIRRAYPSLADVPYEDKKARAVMKAEDLSYYRDTRAEFSRHYRALDRRLGTGLNHRYLNARLALDWLKRNSESPWYMRTVLQVSELERLRLSA